MSTDQIRQIFADVEKFLSETLKKETKLSKKTADQKQQLLEKLQKFFEENPQYKPVQNQDNISIQDETYAGGTEGSSRSDGSEDVNTYNDAGIGLIPAADLKSPVFSGYLDKKQKKGAGIFGVAKFQKRWCVVQAGVFYYYTTPKDKQQNGSFTLEGYQFRNAPDLSSKKAEKELCFELCHDNETKRLYQFMAKNKTEYDQWQSVIEAGGYPFIEEDIYDEVGEGIKSRPEIKVDDEGGEEYEDPDSVASPKVPPPPSPKTINKSLPPPPSPDLPPPLPTSKPPVEVPLMQDDVYDDAFSPDTQATLAPPPVPVSPPHVATPPPPPPDVPPMKKRPQRDLPPPPPEKKRVKLSLKFKAQEDFENRFYGKWDCTGDASNELSFKKGDIIHILSREFDEKEWWVGELDGKFGLVPKTFLTPAFTPMA